jgi:PAS domain S-box-containing protein
MQLSAHVMTKEITSTIRLDLLDAMRRRANSDVDLEVDANADTPMDEAEAIARAPLSVLFQGVYDAALITDLKGHILEANIRATQFFRCSGEELRRVTILDVILGAKEPLLDMVRQNLGRNRFTLVQAYCARHESPPFPAEISISCLELADRDYLCFFIRDITSRKEAEKELARHRNHLEELVNERTAEWEAANQKLQLEIAERQRAEHERQALEEQLRQATKMQAVGQLAGGIAHDFNNLLTGILGSAEMLHRRLAGDERLSRYADRIITASRRAADLTDKLLAFARKGKFRTVPVDLHRLLGDVTALVNHGVTRRIDLVTDFSAAHPVTLGDPTQLENLFLNIALNARDAMPNGGRLTIATCLAELDAESSRQLTPPVPPGHYVTVTISDTGIGMDEDTLSHIFEPFFTTKRDKGGTGLGLASVYGIVRNHKGAIKVTSVPERGSTFDVLLPEAHVDDIPAEGRRTPMPQTDHRARILVVDDDDIVRETADVLLREMGCSVTLCRDGAEAVDYYRTHWPEIDAVILDLIMPGLSGGDTFHAMKDINPDIKAAISTGYTADDDIRKVLVSEVQAFLRKPFDSEDLANLLASMDIK